MYSLLLAHSQSPNLPKTARCSGRPPHTETRAQGAVSQQKGSHGWLVFHGRKIMVGPFSLSVFPVHHLKPSKAICLICTLGHRPRSELRFLPGRCVSHGVSATIRGRPCFSSRGPSGFLPEGLCVPKFRPPPGDAQAPAGARRAKCRALVPWGVGQEKTGIGCPL